MSGAERNPADGDLSQGIAFCDSAHSCGKLATRDTDSASAVSDLQPSGAAAGGRRWTLVTITPDPEAPFDPERSLRSEQAIDEQALARLMGSPRVVEARIDGWALFTGLAFAFGLGVSLARLIAERAP